MKKYFTVPNYLSVISILATILTPILMYMYISGDEDLNRTNNKEGVEKKYNHPEEQSKLIVNDKSKSKSKPETKLKPESVIKERPKLVGRGKKKPDSELKIKTPDIIKPELKPEKYQLLLCFCGEFIPRSKTLNILQGIVKRSECASQKAIIIECENNDGDARRCYDDGDNDDGYAHKLICT